MRDIALPLQDLLQSMDAEASGAFRARKVQEAFAESVIEVYGESAARLVLKHVQGVSIVRDETPVKDGVKLPPILHVYVDDSLIVSDLDARQQLLGLCLRKHGVHAGLFKFYFSRFGMRERAPFANYFENRLPDAGSQAVASSNKGFDDASEAAMVKRLQVLKVALCQVFGVDASFVVDAINAAYVQPQGKRICNVSLFSSSKDVRALLEGSQDAVCAHMRDLGIPIARYSIREALEWMLPYKAYPSQSAPVVVKKGL